MKLSDFDAVSARRNYIANARKAQNAFALCVLDPTYMMGGSTIYLSSFIDVHPVRKFILDELERAIATWQGELVAMGVDPK